MTTLFTEPGLTIPSATAAEMAAMRLRESVRTNVSYEAERQILALQGIGFALLAIAERLDAVTREPSPAAPPRGRWPFRKADRGQE